MPSAKPNLPSNLPGNISRPNNPATRPGPTTRPAHDASRANHTSDPITRPNPSNPSTRPGTLPGGGMVKPNLPTTKLLLALAWDLIVRRQVNAQRHCLLVPRHVRRVLCNPTRVQEVVMVLAEMELAVSIAQYQSPKRRSTDCASACNQAFFARQSPNHLARRTSLPTDRIGRRSQTVPTFQNVRTCQTVQQLCLVPSR